MKKDPLLSKAIEEGFKKQEDLAKEFPEFAKLSEQEMIVRLQEGFVNFYPDDQRNPYVPVAARGPWIVTYHGAVLHDSGGYGMIGFGHAPDKILQAMNAPHTMANIMTASHAQARLVSRLKKEIGQNRKERCPYTSFLCMNSGSEAVTVATRISDIQAKKLTDDHGPYHGYRLMYLSFKGGFHGRTERPAMLSDSSQKNYRSNLASFRNLNVNYTITPNSLSELEDAFKWAKKEKVFFESMFMEPVMGEGDPGKAVTPEFYKRARELTKEAGTLLVVDSIQAGIRTQGLLSIVDYPGFEHLDAPDMETYSKAVNAGQYPLSILALSEKAQRLYVKGVYGNTKTANPRALDVAVSVLDSLTPELRRNIRERGQEFIDKFEALRKEFPTDITKVQGTGLIISVEVNPEAFKVIGIGQLEEYLRIHGIGVIHGGVNSLRYTPHFNITSDEINLVVDALREALKHGPRIK